MNRTRIKKKISPWDLKKGDIDRFNGKILEREFIFSGMHRLYTTAYEKDGAQLIHLDKSGPTPTRGKFYHHHLTINRPHHLRLLSKSLQRLAQVIGWPAETELGLANLLTVDSTSGNGSKEKKLRQIALKRLRRNEKLKNELEEYQAKLAEVTELYRASNLPRFRKSLDAFKKLVRGYLPEGRYQKFLAHRENTWILGLEYIAVNRHSKAGTTGFPDFVPQRFDGFHDVIEFKKPSEPLFQLIGGHFRQSTPLKNGLSQLMDYLELFDRNPKGTDELQAPPDKYRPNGLLIIGELRNTPSPPKLREALRKHNSFLQRIEIVTYDQLIDQATNVLKQMEEAQES